MSAYVVDPKTINRILSFCRDQYPNSGSCGFLGSEIKRHLAKAEWDTDNLADLGQAMYNVNINSVCQRYPDCESGHNIPGTMVSADSNELIPFIYRHESCNKFQALKSLHCWLYQSCEGNVEEHPLYKAFEAICRALTSDIVHSLPQYDKAEWA